MNHDWKSEWKGMPEFVQEESKPYQQITVRFASKEDMDEFGKLIGQNLTPKTKSIWHPKLVRGTTTSEKYVNES